MMRKIFLSASALICILLQSCLRPVEPATVKDSPQKISFGEKATMSESEAGAYRLKPLDPLFIRFSGIQEQQGLELVIDENGEISLLHISEPIEVAGLTTSALEEKIERLYIDGAIYKHLSVNVTMTAKIFYVQGEVNSPGIVQLTSGTTLLQAIAGARGYTAFANRKKVTITRQGKVYQYNMKELEKDPSKDVKINAGDVIKVWQSTF